VRFCRQLLHLAYSLLADSGCGKLHATLLTLRNRANLFAIGALGLTTLRNVLVRPSLLSVLEVIYNRRFHLVPSYP
jgi:hypothetical protein